jgi:hypothetical protein
MIKADKEKRVGARLVKATRSASAAYRATFSPVAGINGRKSGTLLSDARSLG